MRLRLPLLFCFLLLSCKDVMHVQTGYISDRDECRGNAERGVGTYVQPESYGLSDKELNTARLQLFCECMKGYDWNVAGCPKKKPPVEVAATPQPQPTVVVVQAPTGQPAVMAPAPMPAPAPAPPVAARHKKRKAPVCVQPKVVCPAPESMTQTPQTPAQGNQQLQGILQK